MRDLKTILLKIYYFASLSKEKADYNQKVIRDIEWDSIKCYIKPNSKFLDVGCGAGYSISKAIIDFNCECVGIDPEPGSHGVGRFNNSINKDIKIIQGFSEKLPFKDGEFDIVYCSHVLEHVIDEENSLAEINRVLKNNGTVIIGMPTSTMAWITFFTELLFSSHQRFFNVIFGPFKFIKTGKTPFINLFLPYSHSSHKAKTILYDIKYYKINNWEKIVNKKFKINKKILPAIYPLPQYWQLFKIRTNKKKTCSVFFICKKY